VQRHRPHLEAQPDQFSHERVPDLARPEDDMQPSLGQGWAMVTLSTGHVSHGWRRTRLVFVHQRPNPSVLPAPTTARPHKTSA